MRLPSTDYLLLEWVTAIAHCRSHSHLEKERRPVQIYFLFLADLLPETATEIRLAKARVTERRRFAADFAYLFPNPCFLLLIGTDFDPACPCRFFPADPFVAAACPCPCSVVVDSAGLCLCLIAAKVTAMESAWRGSWLLLLLFLQLFDLLLNKLVVIFCLLVLRLKFECLIVMLQRIRPIG